MKKIIMLSVIAFIGLTAEAGRNQNREHRQEKRIGQGVQSGELTKREAKRLARGQKKVDHYQKKAMEDGEMSVEEKAKLEKMQDRQSRRIHKQKHDGQSRPDAPAAEQPAAPAESEK
jgi:hypothetical protein